MIARLTRHGDDLALVIEKPMLDALGIDADTPLEVTTDGETLVVAPMRDSKRRKAFESALTKTNREHGGALKRLAE